MTAEFTEETIGAHRALRRTEPRSAGCGFSRLTNQWLGSGRAVPLVDSPRVVLLRLGMAESPTKKSGMPLHKRIFLGMAVGVVAGLTVNQTLGGEHSSVAWIISQFTEPAGSIFLRLLLMIVVPLVFSSLLIGVAGIGDIRKLGRIGFKSFGFCLVISAISVVIGLTLTNLIQPGKRVSAETAAALQAKYGGAAEREIERAQKGTNTDPALMQVVKTLIPSNPVNSLALESPNMIHLMFFTLFLGGGITLLPTDRTAGFMAAIEGLYAISLKLIDLIMQLAPFAVACLLFNNLARFGFDLLQALGWFVVTVLLGLALHMFGVYSLALRLLARVSPVEFFRRIKTVLLTAFSTSSSAATLPTTLKTSEENLKVPREIGNFVLTVGATANQNGTALYEGVTVLFLAQLAGVDLSIGQQLGLAYLAILGSIGTAGVPSASIPFIVIVLATIGVNPALIAIILGLDRILDMCRTTLNVAGDLVAAVFVARSEGHRVMDE